MTPQPTSAVALRRAIDGAAARRSIAPGRLHYTVASTVVLQMVPSGVAKGGGAIRQRVNEHDARLTKDLDYSLDEGIDIDTFVDTFNERLAAGWNGFDGVRHRRACCRLRPIADRQARRSTAAPPTRPDVRRPQQRSAPPAMQRGRSSPRPAERKRPTRGRDLVDRGPRPGGLRVVDGFLRTQRTHDDHRADEPRRAAGYNTFIGAPDNS